MQLNCVNFSSDATHSHYHCRWLLELSWPKMPLLSPTPPAPPSAAVAVVNSIQSATTQWHAAHALRRVKNSCHQWQNNYWKMKKKKIGFEQSVNTRVNNRKDKRDKCKWNAFHTANSNNNNNDDNIVSWGSSRWQNNVPCHRPTTEWMKWRNRDRCKSQQPRTTKCWKCEKFNWKRNTHTQLHLINIRVNAAAASATAVAKR